MSCPREHQPCNDYHCGEEPKDVCRWRLNPNKKNDWIPGCDANSKYNVHGVEWFEFCPYCGKEIDFDD